MSWRFAAGVAGSLAVAGGAFFGGMKYGVQTTRAEQAELRLRDSEDTLKQIRDLSEGVNQVVADAQAKVAEIHANSDQIIREVPYAITPAVDARFPLSNGYVRLYNSAVANALLPAATGESDGAASAVTESEAATVNALNFRVCHEAFGRVAAWEAWARSVTSEGDQ